MTTIETLAREWHALSDHARDGSPFGGFLCNCERVAERLAPMVAERVRAAAERAWSEAVLEAHDLGWMHDFARSDVLGRNPYGPTA